MSLTLYNTLKRKKELFVPLDPSQVGLYACGPTVYDYAHIGNARPVVVVDTLYRLLKMEYPKVTYVRNITDIDDKIIKASKEKNISIDELTKTTAQYYHDDMAQLGALTPDLNPRATEHVEEMIQMIKELVKKGHAYEKDGHVLFSVKSLPEYGQLSRCNHDEMIAGARVEVAPYKRDAEDFILWKPSNADEGQPGWESPWGFGRPGWHIECSAMSSKYLGKSFDIHCGGLDLIFPHHENELAQSKGCYPDSSFARYWVHNGMLMVEGQKMSKSLGNFFTVNQLLEDMPGEVIRYVLLATHYRQPLDWTERAVEQAKCSLERLYGALRGRTLVEGSVVPEVRAALDDDLNTPLAYAALHELASQINKSANAEEQDRLASDLRASAGLMGLLQQDPEVWFTGIECDDFAAEIESLIAARNQARKDKDFAAADRIRDELIEKGVVLEDSAEGTQWKKIV